LTAVEPAAHERQKRRDPSSASKCRQSRLAQPDGELADIRGRFHGARGVPALPIEGMVRERWLVVGTDFSQGSQDALACALRMADVSGAHVALVHAYEEAPGASATEDATPRLLERLVQEIAASGATERGVHVEPCVRRGAPWEKILNVATEHGAEVVIVGCTRRRGATGAFSLGSVASGVLALSTRCVLVARPWVASSQDGGAP